MVFKRSWIEQQGTFENCRKARDSGGDVCFKPHGHLLVNGREMARGGDQRRIKETEPIIITTRCLFAETNGGSDWRTANTVDRKEKQF